MRTELEKIKALLWEEWDPIGVNRLGGPQDEYDRYATKIYSELKSGADKYKISKYLAQVERVSMGLEPSVGHDVIAEKAVAIAGKKT